MKYLKLFTNFRQTLGELQDDEVGRLFLAMLKYAEDGSEPVLQGNERFVWGAATLHMDMARKYSDKQAELGRSGGQSNQSKSKRTEANQSESKRTEADLSECEPKEKKGKEIERLSKESRKKFIPPTLEEVSAFIRESGFTVDPERFVNYYSSNGWKVGRNSMKDWKATIRNWQAKEPKKTQYSNSELEKLEIVL